jgi:hypothetical protein
VEDHRPRQRVALHQKVKAIPGQASPVGTAAKPLPPEPPFQLLAQ